jgi:hypothetical protein
LQRKELEELLLEQVKQFFIPIDGNNNNNNGNLMLKCINGLTGLLLLFVRKAPFNLLFNAIFNSAIGTLGNKKVLRR